MPTPSAQEASAEEPHPGQVSTLAHTQRLESLGQLAAGIAHEINTPAQFVSDNVRFLQTEFSNLLRLIQRYEELLLNESTLDFKKRQMGSFQQEIDFEFVKTEVPHAIRQSLEGLDRITTIVRAMKDFSHPGAAVKEPADVARLIASTIEVCRNRWKYVANLKTDFEPNLPLVPCLVSELNQVILNLVVNAADAIAEKYGNDCDRRGMITVSARRVDEFLEIRVTDDGTGIPQQHRRHMFEQFFTTKPVGKGTGQGLPLCREVIVNKHGGTILFESSEGVGTTFILTLPLQDPTASRSDVFQSPEAA